MLGVVNLDKPVGPTSHDMVGLLRRLSGTRRIGHAGTLDPLASGVLPILVGAATRFSAELTGGDKRYLAVVRLGATSDTDDSEGPIHPGSGQLPAEDAVEAATKAFIATFDQRPPAFSARKAGGVVAHRAARAGAPIDLPERQVTIHAIDIMGFTSHSNGAGDLTLDVHCGSGTYIRSLARDLGNVLGCGGYLHSLRRTEAAGLAVSEAVTPEELDALAVAGRLDEAILPVASLLRLPHVSLDPAQARSFANGVAQAVRGSPTGRTAVFTGDRLLGIGSVTGDVLQPEKVLPEAEDR